MEERRTENTDVSSEITQAEPNPTDLETAEIASEEHLEAAAEEDVRSDAATVGSDAVVNNESEAVTEQQTEENANSEEKQPLTLEQARDLCCVSFNNALYLAQFPEILEHLQQQVAANIKENPGYAMAVENAVDFLAAQVGMKVVATEVGKPLTTQYQCTVSSCNLEQSAVECLDTKCETENPEASSASAPSLTA